MWEDCSLPSAVSGTERRAIVATHTAEGERATAEFIIEDVVLFNSIAIRAIDKRQGYPVKLIGTHQRFLSVLLLIGPISQSFQLFRGRGFSSSSLSSSAGTWSTAGPGRQLRFTGNLGVVPH